MPSGSKKRKAAKKKKEQAANNINSSTNNNNPHGNDDPKSQDERDSDGGDIGSPASQDDHNRQNPFSQGEEEGKGAPSPVRSYVTEDKPVEQATIDTESTEKSGLDGVVDIKVVKEMEFKNELESSHVSIQHVKHDESSHVSIQHVKHDKSSHVSIQHVKHDKSSGSSSSNSSDDESQASEKNSKEEASNFVVEATSYVNEANSDEAVKVAKNETTGNGDIISTVETAAIDNVVIGGLSVPEKVDHATDISVNESVVCDVVESEMKESEEKLLPSSNGVSGVESEENEGKISSSSGIPIAESSNVVEKNQHSGTPEYSEKQPLVASTAPVVQRTSVFSCCGLFDIFTGSGR